MPTTVHVLTLPSCGPCSSVLGAYHRGGVPAEPRDMSTDDRAADLARSLGYAGSPITVVFDENGTIVDHFKDYRPERIREVIRSHNTPCSGSDAMM